MALIGVSVETDTTHAAQFETASDGANVVQSNHLYKEYSRTVEKVKSVNNLART